jgi:hypothetical protein
VNAFNAGGGDFWENKFEIIFYPKILVPGIERLRDREAQFCHKKNP